MIPAIKRVGRAVVRVAGEREGSQRAAFVAGVFEKVRGLPLAGDSEPSVPFVAIPRGRREESASQNQLSLPTPVERPPFKQRLAPGAAGR
jgi:hypothetical protein